MSGRRSRSGSPQRRRSRSPPRQHRRENTAGTSRDSGKEYERYRHGDHRDRDQLSSNARRRSQSPTRRDEYRQPRSDLGGNHSKYSPTKYESSRIHHSDRNYNRQHRDTEHDDSKPNLTRESSSQRDHGRDKREDFRHAIKEEQPKQSEASDSPQKPEEPKQEPNFGLSGKLTADTNTLRGIVIKYNQPPEARISPIRWRLYEFKDNEEPRIIYVHRQSAYLIGREAKVLWATCAESSNISASMSFSSCIIPRLQISRCSIHPCLGSTLVI
jgi:smad nuclear-interacting protein 1